MSGHLHFRKLERHISSATLEPNPLHTPQQGPANLTWMSGVHFSPATATMHGAENQRNLEIKESKAYEGYVAMSV